jgi:hypothetical protein
VRLFPLLECAVVVQEITVCIPSVTVSQVWRRNKAFPGKVFLSPQTGAHQ